MKLDGWWTMANGGRVPGGGQKGLAAAMGAGKVAAMSPLPRSSKQPTGAPVGARPRPFLPWR